MMNRKIIDYQTLLAYPMEIDDYILGEIKDGWQPIGGLSLVIDPDTKKIMFGQAMVKYDN